MRCHSRRPSSPGARVHGARQAGFTLIEVMLAALLLTVGVGAFLGTAVLSVRMVARGRQATRAVQAASAQLELLRATAAASPAACAALSDGADTVAGGMIRRWRVRPSGALAEASVTVVTAVPGGLDEDSLTTTLACP